MQNNFQGWYEKLWLLLVLVFLQISAFAARIQAEERNTVMKSALSDYINLKDSSYRWQVKGLEKHSGMSSIIQAEIVSQLWQPDRLIVDKPLWKHRLAIYIPAQLKNSVGILHVNGGVNHPANSIHGVGPSDVMEFARLAQITGSVVIDLKDVPNQYLTFEGEKPRKEDDLVARTWAAFLENPNTCHDCPIHIGMSKAVVRGMDAAQEILKEHAQISDGFILSGGSKRGWAVWLTAAVDKRVKAIIPSVIDVLNVQKCLDHSYEAFGFWIPPLEPYRAYGQDILGQMHTSAMNRLMEEIDPLNLRDYLTLPKYVITAAGDDFFPPDNSRFYWENLAGPKWLRTFPNARHYIFRDSSLAITETIASFVGAIASGKTLPVVNSRDLDVNGGKVTISGIPKQSRLWQVTNPGARDFRMTTLKPAGLEYRALPLVPECSAKGGGQRECEINIKVSKPSAGWTAWFAEFVFSNDPYPDFVVTTPVKVTPDTYPARSPDKKQ